MKTIGSIGITDIPQLTNADKVKAHLPLMNELMEAIKSTDYMNPNNLHVKLVNNLFKNGGGIYYSQEALKEYGQEQVAIAFKYFKEFWNSSTPTLEERTAVCAWISNNIFNVEQMKSDSLIQQF